MPTYIVDIVFICWIILLIVKGLQPSDNWLGWLMFSRAQYFQAKLHDKNGQLDIWEYLPHCQVMLSKRQIESLIRYIQDDRKAGYIEGSVRMMLTEGERLYVVKKSFLIPQDEKEV